MTPEIALALSHVSASYGKAVIIQDVSLDLPRGSVLALMGPNGSGKSTLLKSICKLVPNLSGEIQILGREHAKQSTMDLARLASYVPQTEPAKFGFSVLQMVLMARASSSPQLYESESDLDIAIDAMKRASSFQLKDRSVTELSGGEMQRVLIARALAQQCDLILMDEPTAHLDISHRLQIESLIRALRAEGKSVLMASHDFQSVATIADHMAILENGTIALAGRTQEVLESKELDRIYNVNFTRIYSGSKVPILIANEPTLSVSNDLLCTTER